MQRPMQQAGDAFRGRRLAARGGGIDSGGSIWGLVGAGRRPEVQAQRPVQPVRRPRRAPSCAGMRGCRHGALGAWGAPRAGAGRPAASRSARARARRADGRVRPAPRTAPTPAARAPRQFQPCGDPKPSISARAGRQPGRGQRQQGGGALPDRRHQRVLHGQVGRPARGRADDLARLHAAALPRCGRALHHCTA